MAELTQIYSSLVPRKPTEITPPQNTTKEMLILAGFVDIIAHQNGKFTVTRPAGETMKWARAQTNVEEETIDEDALLTAEDLIRPDNKAPEGCETKAKACKDCSCGRAEVLIAEALTEKNGTDAVVKPLSNCNKCSMGDAFRCASCPYIGMPAFKPGETITIPTNMMQDDI